MESSLQKAKVLMEALPYIQKFRQAMVVIKFGGSAMENPELVRETMRDVVLMECIGMRPIVVHGGGKAISAELKKQNENLRISLNTMSQKPGRKEMQRLDVYQTASERLSMNSPGFAPVWQAALKESEEEFKKTFLGLTPYLRKHISTKASDAVLISNDDSSN